MICTIHNLPKSDGNAQVKLLLCLSKNWTSECIIPQRNTEIAFGGHHQYSSFNNNPTHPPNRQQLITNKWNVHKLLILQQPQLSLKRILSQAARAIFSNASRSIPTRVLFDSGNQRSYIRMSPRLN